MTVASKTEARTRREVQRKMLHQDFGLVGLVHAPCTYQLPSKHKNETEYIEDAEKT